MRHGRLGRRRCSGLRGTCWRRTLGSWRLGSSRFCCGLLAGLRSRHHLGAAIAKLAATRQIGVILPEMATSSAGPRCPAGTCVDVAGARSGARWRRRTACGRPGVRAGSGARATLDTVGAEVLPPRDSLRGPRGVADTRVSAAGSCRRGITPPGRSRGRRRRSGWGRWRTCRPFPAGSHRSLSGPHRTRRVARIPLAAPHRIGQQQIRLLDREEPGLVAVSAVRVVSLGQTPMRGLDLVVGRAAGHPELPVWVLCPAHATHGDRR